MNNKVTQLIESSCTTIKAKGIRIVRGPWLELDNEGNIVACDPLVACLIAEEVMPELDPKDLALMSRPGLVKAVCLLLEVNASWLFRFWMGFDRGHQLIIVSEKEGKKEESRCEVASFGLQLARELDL